MVTREDLRIQQCELAVNASKCLGEKEEELKLSFCMVSDTKGELLLLLRLHNCVVQT